MEAKLLFRAAESLTFESVRALTPGTRSTQSLIPPDKNDISQRNEDNLWTETGLGLLNGSGDNTEDGTCDGKYRG